MVSTSYSLKIKSLERLHCWKGWESTFPEQGREWGASEHPGPVLRTTGGHILEVASSNSLEALFFNIRKMIHISHIFIIDFFVHGDKKNGPTIFLPFISLSYFKIRFIIIYRYYRKCYFKNISGGVFLIKVICFFRSYYKILNLLNLGKM